MTLMNVVILRCMVVSPSNPAMHASLTTHPTMDGLSPKVKLYAPLKTWQSIT